jgi:hypothetical protein
VAGSTTGIRLAMTRGRGGGGESGEDDPDRWAPSISDGVTVTGGRPAHARSWARD